MILRKLGLKDSLLRESMASPHRAQWLHRTRVNPHVPPLFGGGQGTLYIFQSP